MQYKTSREVHFMMLDYTYTYDLGKTAPEVALCRYCKDEGLNYDHTVASARTARRQRRKRWVFFKKRLKKQQTVGLCAQRKPV
jgi:hypothetical protein